MVRQGLGHIVNTASMAGLAAAGQITSYVMSKHAIVGLSLALRSEAAGRGVGVLAICPTAVETPILDKGAIGEFVGRDFYKMGQRNALVLLGRRLGQGRAARDREEQGAAGVAAAGAPGVAVLPPCPRSVAAHVDWLRQQAAGGAGSARVVSHRVVQWSRNTG